jgi:DNA topoisomerase-1
MPPKKTHIVKRTKKESSNSAPADAAPHTPAAAGKKLVIVESPSKCKKITEYLGAAEYRVVATRGHIYEIEGLSAISKTTYSPKYTILPHQKETIKMLHQEIAAASEVLLATDDDREGEAIAYHVALQFGLPPETTPRIVFHEITRPALQAAVASPRRIKLDLVIAQQSRAVLDIIVGFKISPVLWRFIPAAAAGGKSDALSAGRCQSVALRLVYENYLEEIDAANKIGEPEYKVHGYFYSKNAQFELSRTFSAATAAGDELLEFLEESRTWQHTYLYEESAKKRTSTSAAPFPFNTSALIQMCSNTLHLSPVQTMKICQELYQGGYITYMRTDSRKFSAPFLETARKYISARWGEKYLRADWDKISTAAAAAAAATPAAESHEAIRPTHIECTALPDDFDGRHAAVYRIIRNYTIASCMADAQLENRTIHITAPRDNIYKYPISHAIFAGWKNAVETTDTQMQAGEQWTFFENFPKKNATVQYNSITAATIKYSYSHYTEAGLVKKMEELGIGRPSTFSSLVDVIQKRGYVKKMDIEGKKFSCIEYSICGAGAPITRATVEREYGREHKKLVIQPVGITTAEFLLRNFEEFLNYDYTSKMEFELDLIAAGAGGEAKQKKMCGECYKQLGEKIKSLRTDAEKEYKIDDSHVLVFTRHGPVIRGGAGGSAAPAYKNIKPGIDIDITKLERGEYKIEDLLEIKNDCLGMYEGEPMYLKRGKYGLYVEWGGSGGATLNRVPLKNIGISPNNITIEDVISFLKTTTGSARSSPNIIRNVSADISIRKGKYGPYLFYQTPDMEAPKFISIPKKICKDVILYKVEQIENFVRERVGSDAAAGGEAAADAR